jgi:hypothetical protein
MSDQRLRQELQISAIQDEITTTYKQSWEENLEITNCARLPKQILVQREGGALSADRGRVELNTFFYIIPQRK